MLVANKMRKFCYIQNRTKWDQKDETKNRIGKNSEKCWAKIVFFLLLYELSVFSECYCIFSAYWLLLLVSHLSIPAIAHSLPLLWYIYTFERCNSREKSLKPLTFHCYMRVAHSFFFSRCECALYLCASVFGSRASPSPTKNVQMRSQWADVWKSSALVVAFDLSCHYLYRTCVYIYERMCAN